MPTANETSKFSIGDDDEIKEKITEKTNNTETNCPICLCEMDESDLKYPLLCPTKCGYNFCLNCIDHLISTSQHGYEEASDGSMQVKVQLQCPQCRGEVKHSINDTLLLRTAYVAKRIVDTNDSELTSSELRMKHDYLSMYGDNNLIKDAEERFRKFQIGEKVEFPASPTKKEQKERSGNNSNGNNTATVNHNEKKNETYIDTSLFFGLEYSMTEDEQLFVTELMISGDSDKLAEASQILNGIQLIAMQGITPSMRAGKQSPSSPSNNNNASRQKRSGTVNRASAASYNSRNRQLTDKQRKEQELEQEMEKLKKLHPLPARLPKYTSLSSFDTVNKKNKRKMTLTFVDDEWDGSIADAFSRANLSQTKSNSKGIENILSLSETGQYLQTTPTSRVLIQTIKGEAGKVGLQRGDVVTHVNGEKFTGNAESLALMIHSIYYNSPDNPEKFAIVVNADPSTAEVLKLRSQACSKLLNRK